MADTRNPSEQDLADAADLLDQRDEHHREADEQPYEPEQAAQMAAALGGYPPAEPPTDADMVEAMKATEVRAPKKGLLSKSIPVRFPEDTLAQMRRMAEADHRTISSWIRHVVQQELDDPRSSY